MHLLEQRKHLGLHGRKIGLAIVFLVLTLTIGYAAAITCDAVDCTGTNDCSDEQADECQSDAMFIGSDQFWSCNGACWKSNVGGTISVCEAATPVQSCAYDGGVACSGNVQTRDCETIAMTILQNLLGMFGEKCGGGCVGSWTDVPGSELNNCS